MSEGFWGAASMESSVRVAIVLDVPIDNRVLSSFQLFDQPRGRRLTRPAYAAQSGGLM